MDRTDILEKPEMITKKKYKKKYQLNISFPLILPFIIIIIKK